MSFEEETGISGKAIFGGIIAFVLIIIALTWIVQGNEFFLYKVFAPAQEQARRDTFKQSEAYNAGMAQEIQNMQYQYVQADPEAKAALASIILAKTADYDINKFPDEQKNFVQMLRDQRKAPPLPSSTSSNTKSK